MKEKSLIFFTFLFYFYLPTEIGFFNYIISTSDLKQPFGKLMQTKNYKDLNRYTVKTNMMNSK